MPCIEQFKEPKMRMLRSFSNSQVELNDVCAKNHAILLHNYVTSCIRPDIEDILSYLKTLYEKYRSVLCGMELAFQILTTICEILANNSTFSMLSRMAGEDQIVEVFELAAKEMHEFFSASHNQSSPIVTSIQR